ncbi:NAD-dependent epimerase/dehydratase family protein [Alteribacter natronophilus]|uniref:NAD-dependent epimerase/dehydratase family protein n=1 Tax=Alteribacter natronophilus TaxID=2583810 RepID=UPI00110D3475|nr:NAD-dependent epimerase/dehydratase family protein [Alteribacter natronophilus]TMW72360.1 NAD-dependent epimerase/dehydratase family protein [Alteribacter natronophilus]
MKKAVITGGAGFIGSHTADILSACGIETVIVDNMSTGDRANLTDGSFEVLYEADVTDREALKDVFRNHPDIDGIVHLAAQSKVGPSLVDPGYDAEINIQGTINLLELGREYGVERFVFASSAAVYGDTEIVPVTETAPAAPLSPYGVSKLSGEEYVKAYGRLYNMDTAVLRFANVYGPRQKAAAESGVITIFMNDILHGRRPVIFGDGKQTRDFVYVKDVARAVQAVLTKEVKSSPAVFNVGTGKEITVENMLRHLCDIQETEYAPDFQESRPGDIRRSCLDPSSLASAFSWRPETAFREGLIETIRDYIRTLK